MTKTKTRNKMKKQIEQLKEFHTSFNLPQRTEPTLMPTKEFSLRHAILQEEVDELFAAYNDDDLIEVADAITDCMYVLIGTALQFGMSDVLEKCFNEVHRSNMSKLDSYGNPVMRPDGKVIKSELFSHPNLAQFIIK